MEAIEYWNLCEVLTVVQTALLIVDADPSELQNTIDELPNDHGDTLLYFLQSWLRSTLCLCALQIAGAVATTRSRGGIFQLTQISVSSSPSRWRT